MNSFSPPIRRQLNPGLSFIHMEIFNYPCICAICLNLKFNANLIKNFVVDVSIVEEENRWCRIWVSFNLDEVRWTNGGLIYFKIPKYVFDVFNELKNYKIVQFACEISRFSKLGQLDGHFPNTVVTSSRSATSLSQSMSEKTLPQKQPVPCQFFSCAPVRTFLLRIFVAVSIRGIVEP